MSLVKTYWMQISLNQIAELAPTTKPLGMMKILTLCHATLMGSYLPLSLFLNNRVACTAVILHV